MRLDLNHVNAELARLGYKVQLAKAKGYFFFRDGEASDWIDTVVKVRKLNELTLKQWVAEFHRLRELNQQLMRQAKPGR
jgi:hypothetical protein